MFSKRNKFGKWETLYITKDEENEVREIALKNNLELLAILKNPTHLRDICKTLPDDDVANMSEILTTLSEPEILAIFSTVSKHYHFRAEDYVDWKFITGQSFKKPPKPKVKEKVDTL